MSNRPAMPAGLPTCKQYINFKLVPRAGGGTDKIPIDQVGNVIDAHDPSKWVDAATAWNCVWNVDGIGFVLTPGWIGIDLDKALRDGAWSPLTHELRKTLWGAYGDISPSGTGYHLIMRGRLPDGHKCKREWGEIYSLGRFLTVTGVHATGDANWDASVHTDWLMQRLDLHAEPLLPLPTDGRDPMWRGPEDDDALLALMLTQGAVTAQKKFGAVALMEQKWNMDHGALALAYPADNRTDGLPFDYSSVDMALMSDLSYWTGRDIERMQRIFERWPGYRPWKYQRSRGYHMHRILNRGCNNQHVLGGRTTALVGREAVEGQPAQPGLFLACLESNTFYYRPTGGFWPAVSVDNLIPVIDVGDAKIKATKWLARHHAVHQTTWCPGYDQVIEGYVMRDGVWTAEPGNRVLNLYRPPTPPQPRAGADVEMWLAHLRFVYPAHVEIILDWMAHAAQHPGVKINWALVLGGGQGIGKDSLLAPLLRAVGEWNWRETTPETILTSQFNEYLMCRVLRINEAKDTGGESRYQFYDKTKTIITAPPSVHSINAKNQRPFQIPNLNAVIITTNYRTGGLYLAADDRRHYVTFSDVTRQAFTETYWSSYWQWMTDGGLEACAAFLMARDVSRFNPKAPPLQTPEFWEMVDGGQQSEAGELSDVLSSMNGKAFSLDDLAGVAMFDMKNQTLADWLKNKANGTKIRRALEDAGVVQYRNPDEKRRGRWYINGKPITLYKLPG